MFMKKRKKVYTAVMVICVLFANLLVVLPAVAVENPRSLLFQANNSNALVDSYNGWEDATLSGEQYVYDTVGFTDTLKLAGNTNSSLVYRSLLRFNLSSLTDFSSLINLGDAELTYKVASTPSKSGRVLLYKLTNDDADWISAENSSLGALAFGYACSALKKRDSYANGGSLGQYNDRPNDGIEWSGGYQLGAPGGGSYEASPIAVCDFTSNSKELKFTIPATTISEWVNGANTGLLMRFEDETSNSITLCSANNSGMSLRPSLKVSYTGNLPMLYCDSVSYTDANGLVISNLNDSTSSVTVTANVINGTLETKTPVIIASIYNQSINSNEFKAINTGSTAIASGASASISATINTAAIGVSGRDIIKVMLWEDFISITPLQNVDVFPKEYYTNNVINYNASENQVRGDNWSYLTSNSEISKSIYSPVIGMCKKNNSTPSNNWFTSVDRMDNWLTSPYGDILTEKSQLILYNYTIGEKTAGRELKISGTFTGATSTDLYIIKTKDTIQSVSDYGKDAVVFSKDHMEDVIAYYPELSNNGGRFEITIPAEEAIIGNDILFWIDTKGSGYVLNGFNATIERNVIPTQAKKSNPNVFSNSIANFPDVNMVGADKWSFFHSSAVSSDGATFSLGSPLIKGNAAKFGNAFVGTNDYPEYVWYVNSNGQWGSDSFQFDWVYTLDNNFGNADGGMKVRGRLGTFSNIRVRVLLTSDNDMATVGANTTLLYDQTLSSHIIDIDIPAGITKPGNDIIFLVQKTSGDQWWNPCYVNFSVKGLYN